MADKVCNVDNDWCVKIRGDVDDLHNIITLLSILYQYIKVHYSMIVACIK